MITAYIVHLLILFGVFAIAALALNLTLGWTGLINLGHIAFLAIGGYMSAILTTQYGWPMWGGIAVGMVCAALVGTLLALLSHSVKGDMLAIILLGFNFALYGFAMNWREFTRGPLGIPGIPRPEFFHTDIQYLFLIILFVCGTTYLVSLVTCSPFGRVLQALRDDELYARVLGKRVFRIKLYVFALSGALAALAGALEAHAIRFIDPKSFFLDSLVLVLSMIFVGGLATVRGTLVGALVMTFVPEIVNLFITSSSSTIGALRAMTFSVVLILVVLFKPKGLFGTVELPSSYAERD